MPLDKLTAFLQEQELVRTDDLEQLRGTKIAIDAQHWMMRLAARIHEPLYSVMGSTPLTMDQVIEEELNLYKDAGISPIFVFQGLPTVQASCQDLNAPLLDLYGKREKAWEDFHRNGQEYRTLFSSGLVNPDFSSNLIRILRRTGMEFFKAPYQAWAQMAYLYQQGKERCVHHIQGPKELIMFEHVDVLIIELLFRERKFEFVRKRNVRAKLTKQPLTESQFLDCCLLSGLRGGAMRHPRFAGADPFDKVAQTLQKCENAAEYIRSKSRTEENVPQLIKAHSRARAAVQHSLVLTLDGECLPLTHTKSRTRPGDGRLPKKLSDIWGYKLPNLLYLFLSFGAVQREVLLHVAQNQMVEHLPLVDTVEHREYLRRINPLRAQIAFQIVKLLDGRDPAFSRRDEGNIALWRWYSKDRTWMAHPRPPQLDEWNIQHHDIMKRMILAGGANREDIDFFFVVRHFSRHACKEKAYVTFEEVLCAIHLKTLDSLGYFEHVKQHSAHANSSSPSVHSKALLQSALPEFSELTVLLIELYRTRALTSKHFRYVHDTCESQDPWQSGVRDPQHFPPLRLPEVYMSQGVDMQQEYDECCLLLSRVWSLVPAQLHSKPWNSEVSKDLLAFQVIVNSLQKTLRSLTEVVAVILFLESRTTIDPYHYYELPEKLPFGQGINVALGVVIDYIMRSSVDFGLGDGCNSRRARLAHLHQKFPCCKDLRADLERGFRFWVSAIRVVRELTDAGAQSGSGDVLAMLESADSLLRVMLTRVVDLGEDNDQDYQDPG